MKVENSIQDFRSLSLCCSTEDAAAATTTARGDDIFISLLEPAESGPSRNAESADIAISGDRLSVCISKLDSSIWVPICAVVFEDKLVVCKKSKQSGVICATLFLSSELANFHKHAIPKFHGPPIAECVLSAPAPCPSPSLKPPSHSPSHLQYKPVVKLLLPGPSSKLECEGLCECVEAELFLQLFVADCHIPTAAVLLVGGPNGHILYCNLRSVTKNNQFLKERTAEMVTSNLFKPLYSLDQPVMSIHAAHFPKRHEQIDPSLFVDDLFSSSSAIPNSLLFLGQRGKVAICYSEGSTESQKFAQIIEYNIPGPILSSRLIPAQCLIYNSLRNLHHIDLREKYFKEAEENSPQLQLRRGPLLIPEASFKFPERVSISIPPSVLVDCELISAADSDPDSMELDATTTGEVGITVVSFRGDIRSLKAKVGGKESVSRDPEVITREIKQCLKSMQATSDETSAMSDTISKVNASLIELNHVLRLLCVVKCRLEGTPCLIDNQEMCPLKCAVSAGFKERGVLEREMCVDVRLSYHGQKSLGRGWSLLIQVSSSSRGSHDHLNSAFSFGHAEKVGIPLTTPTISRYIPLEGLANNSTLEERIPISFTQEGLLCFSVSCYLHYDPSNLTAALNKEDNSLSCDHSVSILLNSRLLDTLDFTRPFVEVPRKLHQPLTLATACLNPKHHSFSSSRAPSHLIELPVQCEMLGSPRQQQNSDEAGVYRKLSSLLLPHIAGVEENFQNGTEIKLTSYNGSSISLQLEEESESREDHGTSHELSLVIRSSSRSQLAEVVRCIDYRLRRHRSGTTSSPSNLSTPEEELFEREAELKEISQEAVAILDQVTTLEKFSREPLAIQQAELISKTFSLYSRLRQLPH